MLGNINSEYTIISLHTFYLFTKGMISYFSHEGTVSMEIKCLV